ncbi:exported hypothetical protein [Candidatus Terasakiella magnetica]|uniref:Solute-binding protein family 3/N-terminal domain-containing protein n=1 Tax=Candidatus Terasakiella magnetica TaxID=1867952 RepID=A0A1C3REA9_9PROT|nr:ABC transporter substrate-binding protein [Candidatus Terasakiella magnetica]SCA55564.1 exported hypothetical protein [Candidatus Terasakiella magnetica]
MKRLAYLLSTLCLLFAAPVQASKVDVLSYYDSPPFHYSNEFGLVKEVMSLLDKHIEEMDFKYKVVSRPLLNKLISNIQRPFIIPLVNPVWFGDSNRQKYQWSIPLYADSNALLSHPSDPVEFKGYQSFLNQTVAVPSGYRIHFLDDLVNKNKALRLDVPTIKTLVEKVAQKNARMAVVPYVLAYHQVQTNGWQDRVHFSKRPHQSYKRFFMFKNASKQQLEFFNTAIREIQENGQLERVLKKYGY